MSAPLRIRRRTEKSVVSNDGLKPYLDRLLKLIPAEVLSLYLVGSGVIPADNGVGLVIWAIFCLVAVVIVKAFGTSDPANGIKSDWVHVGLSAVAFIIWIYSLGGPFIVWKLYKPYVGSLLILGFTFLVPFFYRGQFD